MESRQGTIDYLGVAPRDRRNGLGRRFAHGAASWLFARGARTVSLVVDADNLAARALYHALGFRLAHHARHASCPVAGHATRRRHRASIATAELH